MLFTQQQKIGTPPAKITITAYQYSCIYNKINIVLTQNKCVYLLNYKSLFTFLSIWEVGSLVELVAQIRSAKMERHTKQIRQ